MTDHWETPDPGSRRPLLLIVLLAGAALTGAFLLGQGFSGAKRTSAPAAVTPSPAPTVTVTTAPTDPLRPVEPTGSLRRNPAGVLVGFPSSQAGAVAAAGNYLAALYEQGNRSARRQQQLLAVIGGSPGDAARIAADLASEDTALAQLLTVPDLQATGVIAYGRVTGYRVDSFSPAAATVDVHVAGGQGLAAAAPDSPARGRTFYEVDRMQLVWREGDWKLQNVSRLVNGGPDLGSIAAQGYTPFPVGGGA